MFDEEILGGWTMIRRWSELRVVRVRHSESKAMLEVAIGGVPTREDAGRRIHVRE